MFFKENNQLPFQPGKKIKLPVAERGCFNTSLERLKKNKNILVKRLTIRLSDGLYNNFSLEEFQKHYGNNLEKIRHFLPQYLPEIMLVYGKDEGGGAGYMVIPEVIQPDELTAEQLKIQSAQLDNFLVDLIEMWRNNDMEIVDFDEPGNLLYGHTKKDQELKPYLVDIYPLIECDKKKFKDKVSDFISKYPAGDFIASKSVINQLGDEVNE